MDTKVNTKTFAQGKHAHISHMPCATITTLTTPLHSPDTTKNPASGQLKHRSQRVMYKGIAQTSTPPGPGPELRQLPRKKVPSRGFAGRDSCVTSPKAPRDAPPEALEVPERGICGRSGELQTSRRVIESIYPCDRGGGRQTHVSSRA